MEKLDNSLVLSACVLLFTGLVAAQDGTVKWSFDTGSNVVASAAIGDEGILYVGSFTETLYALQPDGTEKWRFETDGAVDQPPVIAPDGTIYVGDQLGKVYALNPDGSRQWTFDPELSSGLTGEMALAVDGTLYVGIGGKVFALNPDGSQYWMFDAVTGTRGIVVGPDGVIFITEANGELNALNPDGSVRWTADIERTESPPIFGKDGTIFYGGISASESFFALNPDDGSIIWQQTLGSIRESASIGINGDIYVPTAKNSDNALIAVDPADGSEKWRFEVTGGVQSSPAVGFDGTIYFGTDGDQFFALRPDGTQLWVINVGGDIRSSPTIAENGTVYFGSSDDNLYAVQSSSFGLAASDWPKKQRDVRNTGQFGSDVTRRRFFAPHGFWLDEANKSTITVSHIGGLAGMTRGTVAEFRIDVINRDGTVRFSLEESVEPGSRKEIELLPPDGMAFAGSVVLDAPVKDGSFLAPFLTWELDVSQVLDPLKIGAFFSGPEDAALVHYFPVQANQDVGMGIAVQNIGDNDITCTLEFVNSDGTKQAEELLNLAPLGSVVDFFNDSVPEGFVGTAAFQCDAPVVAVSVDQDFANGGFPTDRLTIKRRN